MQPGRIVQLRGYPDGHPLRRVHPTGFSGPRAVWGSSGRDLRERADGGGGTTEEDSKTNGSGEGSWDGLPRSLWPRDGEVVGSLSGDWRIYQVANGNKLTVDDFVCAWVACHEMKTRGYGVRNKLDKKPLFGGISVPDAEKAAAEVPPTTPQFTHADLGTGCGSVLMMVAWAFLGQIRSVGVEAQDVSFACLRRGLVWNLGRDGSSPQDIVRVRKGDLRSWDGCAAGDVGVESGDGAGDRIASTGQSVAPRFDLITGTPPYFPLDSFVASQNHEQKVRCRVPTRGGAADYIHAASRLLVDSSYDDAGSGSLGGGVFCMVEAAFEKAEVAVLEAVEASGMAVQRRLDVITRSGLPPRFSCWVMTKKGMCHAVESHPINPETSTAASSTSSTNEPFPIQTLILRNKDLTRTDEYTTAMEEMGWVDFERSKSKPEKTVVAPF